MLPNDVIVALDGRPISGGGEPGGAAAAPSADGGDDAAPLSFAAELDEAAALAAGGAATKKKRRRAGAAPPRERGALLGAFARAWADAGPPEAARALQVVHKPVVESSELCALQAASDMCCYNTSARWVTSLLHWAAGGKMCHRPSRPTAPSSRTPA